MRGWFAEIIIKLTTEKPFSQIKQQKNRLHLLQFTKNTQICIYIYTPLAVFVIALNIENHWNYIFQIFEKRLLFTLCNHFLCLHSKLWYLIQNKGGFNAIILFSPLKMNGICHSSLFKSQNCLKQIPKFSLCF